MRKFGLWWFKILVRTVGMLSDGIRMSFRYGFTSGKMLDYVYENKPRGKVLLGIWIDKAYLSHRGWEVIRMRKTHLVELLRRTLDEVLSRQKKVQLLDIASGPARYVFETAAGYGRDQLEALCKDYDERWVAEGNEKAVQAGLENIRFEPGDAFDEASFAPVKGKPDVVVSSGFYDWITDDALVKKSIGIVAQVIKKGGTFVYTIQSGHVDLELTKVFVDFNKNPLSMKTFDVKEFNSWVAGAGFRILESKADPWGQYTVNRAVKE